MTCIQINNLQCSKYQQLTLETPSLHQPSPHQEGQALNWPTIIDGKNLKYICIETSKY